MPNSPKPAAATTADAARFTGNPGRPIRGRARDDRGRRELAVLGRGCERTWDSEWTGHVC